ncbi:MAG: DUF814 domain-containing protein [Desulfovibrio sp.]|nr:DUF814 domain-containing protein [Desulfovibrio sp.]
MDAHLFRRFCDALAPMLEGARLEKIQEPAPGLCVFAFWGAGRKWQLCLRHGRKDAFCFVSTARITAGQAPSATVMRWRKYAAGRRVAAVVAQPWQRKLWLLMGSVPQEGDTQGETQLCWLLLDLREGPSLVFAGPEQGPEPENPHWPQAGQLAAALYQWREWPVLTPALRRSLLHMEEPEQLALLEDLRLDGGDIFCQHLPQEPDNICGVSAWPLPAPLLDGRGEHGGPDVLALLERAGQQLVLAHLAGMQRHTAAQPLTRRMGKLQRLLASLDDEAARLAAMRARQADALALQENLWRWPADMRASSVSVEAGAHGPAREIHLDARLTLRQNMERCFHTARRGQRGQEHLARRRAELTEELAALRQQQEGILAGLVPAGGAALPAGASGHAGSGRGRQSALAGGGLPKNVQLFISDDGFALLRGRDAKGNQAVRRLAAQHDIWLHVDNGPGAHVVIRRTHAGQDVPERTLDQAGGLAACKSWQQDAASARVIYCEVRHVKPMRNAPAGTVRMDKIWASREVPVDHSLETRLAPEGQGG